MSQGKSGNVCLDFVTTRKIYVLHVQMLLFYFLIIYFCCYWYFLMKSEINEVKFIQTNMIEDVTLVAHHQCSICCCRAFHFFFAGCEHERYWKDSKVCSFIQIQMQIQSILLHYNVLHSQTEFDPSYECCHYEIRAPAIFDVDWLKSKYLFVIKLLQHYLNCYKIFLNLFWWNCLDILH